MSLFELLVVFLVIFLVLKPEDLPKVIKKLKELRAFITNAKSEIAHYLDITNEAKELDEDIEKINFYLEKIASMGAEYQGEYSIEAIKAYYHSLIKSKIQEINKNSS